MILPIATPASARSFAGLFVGVILAGTLIPLGATFYELGWSSGIPLLVAGAVCFAVAELVMLTGRRTAAREDAARTEHGQATVVDAKLHRSVRIGAHHPLRLAVSIGGVRVARLLFVIPPVEYTPGAQIEVAFAPSDPGNFLPLE